MTLRFAAGFGFGFGCCVCSFAALWWFIVSVLCFVWGAGWLFLF